MNRLIALTLAFVFCTAYAQAVTIEMVTVGNSGNAPDTEVMTCCGVSTGTSGYGSVGYEYQIGKYEVTAGQYTEFLNAVAKDDPNELYNAAMADPVGSWGANIQRIGSSPNYSYGVAADWAERPVNHISFWDAARFANWLHNGQPTGAQGPATTESGAYHDVGNQSLFGRNADAKYFIPTENEWYKAAYHNKTAGLSASYFNYPTGTDAVPGRNTTESTNSGNNANYYITTYTIGSPYYRTIVGEFELSDSPYGTFDQGGNVIEWNETAVNSLTRGLRGGTFFSDSNELQASFRATAIDPTSGNGLVGFRVASLPIPEPSSKLLGAVAALGLLRRRPRRLAALIIVAVASGVVSEHASADTFGSGANTFDIEFVTVGNVGNSADTTGDPDPAGSVPYSYRIGKFEVSEQMIEKANTLGHLAITKDNLGADKPATSVSWNEAARFVNWLNVSSGHTPAYKFGAQPGDAGYNVNTDIELWTPSDPGYNPNNLYRNSLARYFLPSVDEWYKAAYYDPSSGVYFDYPTGSDTVPTSVPSGTAAGTAVYFQQNAGGPADIKLAGGLSPYGTMGQGGNVWEWEETDLDLVNGPTDSSSARGLRGGAWPSNISGLNASFRNFDDPTYEFEFTGFRVASIPEPNTVLLGAVAGLALLWWRRV